MVRIQAAWRGHLDRQYVTGLRRRREEEEREVQREQERLAHLVTRLQAIRRGGLARSPPPPGPRPFRRCGPVDRVRCHHLTPLLHRYGTDAPWMEGGGTGFAVAREIVWVGGLGPPHPQLVSRT